MSHLPLPLMDRLNKAESAVFKLWMLCFQRISFQIIFHLKIFNFCPPMIFGRLKMSKIIIQPNNKYFIFIYLFYLYYMFLYFRC